jgi:tetratricopeptide (TPR) repeat protein
MNILTRLLLISGFAALFFCSGCGGSNDPDELVNDAARQLVAGEIKAAAASANRAVGLAPQRVDALVLQAIVLEKRGKLDDAIVAASKAVELDPQNFAAQYTLGSLYAADRKYSNEALVALGKALTYRPGDRNTLILLANVAIKVNPEQAMKYLNELARHRQVFETAEYQNIRGIGLVHRQQYAAAEKSFLKACQLRSGNPSYWLNLAVCMDRFLNKGQAAVKIYRRYLDLAPKTPETADSRKLIEARMQALRGRI